MKTIVLAIAAAMALAAIPPESASASQCPPYGTVCASIKCAGAVGGYCCCKPFCSMQPNGTTKCGCSNFCATSCSQACSGNCESGSTCYVGPGGGSVVAEDWNLSVPASFSLSPEALARAEEADYGWILVQALRAWTGTFSRGIPAGVAWNMGGAATPNTLPARYHRPLRKRESVSYKIAWESFEDRVVANIVFLGRRTPAPVSVSLYLDGSLSYTPLDEDRAKEIVDTIQ